MRIQIVALPLSLAGFALHASFAHRALAEREGGQPMFQARELTRAGVDHGLVFVSTDHGFDLGHDPGQQGATRAVVVARYEHDAHDWLLWSRLGRPPSYRYEYDASAGGGTTRVLPYTPQLPPGGWLRFEAEAEWPPLAVEGGWVQPDFSTCASGGRGLRLQPSAGQAAGVSLDLELPSLDRRPRSVNVGWVRDAGPEAALHLTGPGLDAAVRIPSGAAGCVTAKLGLVILPSEPARVRLQASRPGLLDYIEVLP